MWLSENNNVIMIKIIQESEIYGIRGGVKRNYLRNPATAICGVHTTNTTNSIGDHGAVVTGHPEGNSLLALKTLRYVLSKGG